MKDEIIEFLDWLSEKKDLNLFREDYSWLHTEYSYSGVSSLEVEEYVKEWREDHDK